MSCDPSGHPLWCNRAQTGMTPQQSVRYLWFDCYSYLHRLSDVISERVAVFRGKR